VTTGGSYTPIAFNQPNTGSYVWHVDPPGTNTGITPVFSAKILILAYDPSFNQGSDESDNPFSIYDGTVAAVVTKLESFPIDGGVQLKWALGTCVACSSRSTWSGRTTRPVRGSL
jgi:hypothetical protein